MPQPVWLEVALNGPFGPKRQPHAPYTAATLIQEGLACARAGAAIVHLHVYDEATGIQNDAPETYVRVIEAIGEKEDVIVYPTVPMGGGGEPGSPERARARYAVIDELGKRGLLEWSVVDPGSCNLARFEDIAAGGQGVLYPNTVADICEGLRLACEHRFHPSYAVYEPGFLRLGAALAKRHGCPAPIYRFMFSDEFTFSYPPAGYAVEFICEAAGGGSPRCTVDGGGAWGRCVPDCRSYDGAGRPPAGGPGRHAVRMGSLQRGPDRAHGGHRRQSGQRFGDGAGREGGTGAAITSPTA